jgi:hypothetical protein
MGCVLASFPAASRPSLSLGPLALFISAESDQPAKRPAHQTAASDSIAPTAAKASRYSISLPLGCAAAHVLSGFDCFSGSPRCSAQARRVAIPPSTQEQTSTAIRLSASCAYATPNHPDPGRNHHQHTTSARHDSCCTPSRKRPTPVIPASLTLQLQAHRATPTWPQTPTGSIDLAPATGNLPVVTAWLIEAGGPYPYPASANRRTNGRLLAAMPSCLGTPHAQPQPTPHLGQQQAASCTPCCLQGAAAPPPPPPPPPTSPTPPPHLVLFVSPGCGGSAFPQYHPMP